MPRLRGPARLPLLAAALLLSAVAAQGPQQPAAAQGPQQPAAAQGPQQPAAAEPPLAAERVGQVAELEPGTHRVWITDLLFRRTALFDADRARMLGMLSAGVGVIAPDWSGPRGEIYLPATYYSRGSRGERTDVVGVYDARRLAPVAEVEIPPHRADYVHAAASSALLDDGRFLVVFNLTPATSVSVVDVETRRFVGEIATPGCVQVYPTGPRRFAMLCGDGTLLQVALDARGGLAARARSERFFDPGSDPVLDKGVRVGTRWIFVSFAGRVHEVDFAGEAPRFREPWPLFDDSEVEQGWQVGGTQPLAVHAASARLYVLAHRGGPDGHKDPGTEVQAFDLASQRRTLRVPASNVLGSFLAQQMGAEEGMLAWIVRHLVPNPGVDLIAVTPDEAPLLLMASRSGGSVAVHDARSGAHLRDLHEVGLAPGRLEVFAP